MPQPIRKIVFIEPKAPGFHVYSKFRYPRLGTLQLGTILKRAGYKVKVFLEESYGIDFDEILDADAVGISTIMSTAPRAYEMARQIRKAGIPVFMGGPHVTFVPEEALESCDYVLRGEAEDSITPLIKAMESGQGYEQVPGLAWKSEGRMRSNLLPPLIQDLDRYPFPDFNLICRKKNIKKDLSAVPIMTSRGCPFGCNFCVVTKMFGRGYRFRSTENVIQELKMRDPEYVFFYDDNFAAKPSHTKELLRRMIEEGVTPKWAAQVRIDVARDPELLDLMKRSGCYYVYVGLESINPQTLAALKKGQTPEQMEEAIRIIQGHGIKMHGMFMFGADHDDKKTIRKTIKFAKKTGIATIQFLILTPVPGTVLFEQLETEGRLLTRDWSYYDGHYAVFEPKKMNFLQLQKLTVRAMQKFYSIPHILKCLTRFDILTLLYRGYAWRLGRRGYHEVNRLTKQVKKHCKKVGMSIESARQGLQFRARRTADDIKDYFSSFNFDIIRRMREERIHHKNP